MFLQRKVLSLKVGLCVCVVVLVYYCQTLFVSYQPPSDISTRFVARHHHEWGNSSGQSENRSIQPQIMIASDNAELAASDSALEGPVEDPPLVYTTADGQCNIRNILGTRFEESKALEALDHCTRVFYNRVPKCGSRTVLSTFKTLARQHQYELLDEERWNNMNILNTYNLRKTFADSFGAHQPPFLFSQHVHYVNFTEYGILPPVYVNVVREPIDRLASHYYYNEYGSNSAPKEVAKTNMTLDECVEHKLRRCLDINVVLPFFCGHSSMCQTLSNEALQQAKRHLVSDYLVVGIQEDLAAFMELLELLLPKFFAGAPKIFSGIEDDLRAKYATVKRTEVEKKTVTYLKKRYQYEYDFYYFIKARFYNTLSSMRTRQ